MPLSSATLRLLSYGPPFSGSRGVMRVQANFSAAYAQGSFLLNSAFTAANLKNALQLDWIRSFNSPPNADGFSAILKDTFVRSGPVTGATLSAGVLTVTIASGHPVLTGEPVTIRRVIGAVEINQTYSGPNVIRTSSTVLTIRNFVGSITAFSASADSIVEVVRPHAAEAITSVAIVNGKPSITCAAVHNRVPGEQVVLTGITGTFTGPTFQNVVVSVDSCPSTTVMVLNVPGQTALETGTGGTFTPIRNTRDYGTLALAQQKILPLASVSNATIAVYTLGTANHGLAVGDVATPALLAGTVPAALVVPNLVVRTVAGAAITLEAAGTGIPVTGAGATVTANTGFLASFGGLAGGALPINESPIIDIELSTANPSRLNPRGPFLIL